MDTKEMIMAAIEKVKGGPFAPGQIVAHINDPITKSFVRSEGDTCIVELRGKEYRWTLADTFDPNMARDQALRIKFGLSDDVQFLGTIGGAAVGIV